MKNNVRNHKRIGGAGQCPICKHSGTDCTGRLHGKDCSICPTPAQMSYNMIARTFRMAAVALEHGQYKGGRTKATEAFRQLTEPRATDRAGWGGYAIPFGNPDHEDSMQDTDSARGLDSSASDTVANILHYVNQNGGDPKRVIRMAVSNFEAERKSA